MQLHELKMTWHERSNTAVSENVNINISCYLKILSIWTSFRNVRYKFSSGKYPVFRTMFGPSGCALGRKTVRERKKLCADWLICSHVHTIREVCCDWLTRFASITQCRAVLFVSISYGIYRKQRSKRSNLFPISQGNKIILHVCETVNSLSPDIRQIIDLQINFLSDRPRSI